MRIVAYLLLVVLGGIANATALAESPRPDIQSVVALFRSTLPKSEDLNVYRLDWVADLAAAKQKAAIEKRPILLIIVTNSYGNLYSGHC